MRPEQALIGLWVLWMLSWVVAAVWTNRTERRPPVRAEAGYRAIQTGGALLLFLPSHLLRAPRLWSVDLIGAWLCVALVALGMTIAWWARLHLGRLWSGHITRKADHKIVDTGPYALVRHPIYTGLLLGLAATAVLEGTVSALLGCVLFWLGFYLKARIEERWLAQELGADAYADYQRRVPMQVPLRWRANRRQSIP
jgi:protein-S-isoprenylcysteine O-methyltransferase Ste14